MALHRMSMSEEMSDKEKEEVREMMMSQGMLENMMEDMEEKGEDSEEHSMRRDMMEDNMDDMQKAKMEMEKMHAEMKMFESSDYVSEIQKRVRDFMSEGGAIRENMDALMKLMSVAPEDGFCVDQAKYREFGRCDPATAMECMLSMDRELLDPMSTRDRLCL